MNKLKPPENYRKVGGEKYCGKCKDTKPRSEFGKNAPSPDGLQHWCLACRKTYRDSEQAIQYRKNYRKDYLERDRIMGKTWRAKNRDFVSAKNKAYSQKNLAQKRAHGKQYYQNNKEKFRVYVQKSRAKRAGLISDLTRDEWELTLEMYNYRCAYCMTSQDDLDGALAQDHIVPIKKGGGYTLDNIVPACKSCNSSKRDRSLLDFLGWREKMRVV